MKEGQRGSKCIPCDPLEKTHMSGFSMFSFCKEYGQKKLYIIIHMGFYGAPYKARVHNGISGSYMDASSNL